MLAGGSRHWYDGDMANYDRIIRECFWDSRSSMEEIQHIIAGDDRRKNIAEVFFLDKELKIGELKWTG
jgi:hypothetical protein